MSYRKKRVFFFIACFFCVSYSYSDTGCKKSIAIVKDNAVSIYIDSSHIVRELEPTFFGFSLDLIAFQKDFWDKEHQRVMPELIDWLRAFPFAVYRFPGGALSNSFNWEKSIGPLSQRSPQKLVTWQKAFPIQFGFDEYMEFVRAVNGNAWITLNIYGNLENEVNPFELSLTSRRWVEYAKHKYPMQPVLRWELGNELYQAQNSTENSQSPLEFIKDKILDDRSGWSPQKYVNSAIININEISKSFGDIPFVALLQDFKRDPFYMYLTLAEYNLAVINKLSPFMSEFVLHPYFDSVGNIYEDTVQHRLDYICDNVAKIKQYTIRNYPGLWLTEVAKWPRKDKGQEWNMGWWRASSLEAGVSVADMIIGASQIPEVNGAFVHTLASNTGPWAMFHSDKNGHIYPSIIYWTLRLLREHSQKYLLSTRTISTNLSEYAGGYDVRAASFTNESHTKYSLWTINRSHQSQHVYFVIEGHGGELLKGTQTYLSNQDINAINREKKDNVIPITRQIAIQLDQQGKGVIDLPLNSVDVFDFSLVK